jgi:hypothetical protein
LRTLVAPFIEKARKVTSPGTWWARTRRSDIRNKEIRDWARGRGLKVNERGRIPADIAAEYETVNPK